MQKQVARHAGRDQRSTRTMSWGRGSTTAGMVKDRYFNIFCKLEPTDEKFTLKNIYLEMRIKDLKAYSEFITGIPVNLQRLYYLDKGDLIDQTDIRHNDIVPGALLYMKVWKTWHSLIEAVVSGDADWIFSLGVTADSTFRSPNSDYMAYQNPKIRQRWLEERGFVALFIASHRGNQKLCAKLIESGANVNSRTPCGRSPLHVAAAMGHGSIVDLLLEKGADIDAADNNGDTPLTVAEKFGNKVCERHLFLFRWQQRAKQTLRNKLRIDRFAHQYFDSANPVWLKGREAQIYLAQILPPGEFEGTTIDAPLRRPKSMFVNGSRTLTSYSESDSDISDDDDEHSDLQKANNKYMMPAIKEESSTASLVSSKVSITRAANRHGKQKRIQSGKTYDDWLREKRKTEQYKVRSRKESEQKEQFVLETKRSELARKQSFDALLSRQDGCQPPSSTGSPNSVPFSIERFTNATTTGEIIQNIINRRQEQFNNKEKPNLWLSVGDDNFYEKIKRRGSLLAKRYI